MTRMAVIGLGTMGRNHLRVLADMDQVEIAAVCDLDPNAVAVMERKYGAPGFTSWDEMLETVELEAAIVAVPTRFHLAAGLAVVEHGLDVLVEKPIAANLDEGRRLVAAATAAGRLLAVGHVERFNPAVRELKRRTVAGDNGRLFQLQARREGPFPARIRDVGVVIDLATHDLDVMNDIANAHIVRLYAETERRIHTDHEDILNALLKFESGMLGVLQVNWLTPTKVRELTVLGERGLFVCNYLTQELLFFKNAEIAPREARRHPRSVSEGEGVIFPIAKAEPLRMELESFVSAVRGEGPVEVDGEAGLHALHVAGALVRSATEARLITRAELDHMWIRDSLGLTFHQAE